MQSSVHQLGGITPLPPHTHNGRFYSNFRRGISRAVDPVTVTQCKKRGWCEAGAHSKASQVRLMAPDSQGAEGPGTLVQSLMASKQQATQREFLSISIDSNYTSKVVARIK